MPRSRGTERLLHAGLAALYFAVVTPAGLCVRAVRDPLRRAWDGDRASYLDRPAGGRPGRRAAERADG
ncbi:MULTISPECIES: hypothetical protein [Streptomyces]|uniref:Uncharacterized protein n=1 Tax=Streptomyces murinus TaxID=33900 RepID=A0A7W3RJF1_STRMR|nr:hypothetical protein [Streptomyces murinus]MBA9051972.1 hypothetical protein [Streptomyces murinus]UWW93259.1 hypothetical protein GO605_22395 [Streptomyces murinus]